MDKFDRNDSNIFKRMIAENSVAFAFLNRMPIVPGHVLICPKRHVASSEELSIDEWKGILQLKETICHRLKQHLAVEGFNFAWNEGGVVAGQTVPHFHLHVVPRKKGDEGITQYEPRLFLYRPGTRAQSPEEELESLAEILRK